MKQMTLAYDTVFKDLTGASILCVIDFKEGTTDALHAAFNIAGSTNSPLTVLYPYRLNQPRSMADMGQWKKSIDLDASNNFARMSRSLLDQSNITCDFKPEVGFINDRIDAFSQRNNMGMIIISKQLAESSNEHFFDMLGRIGCPVLIVPGKQIS